MAAQIPAKELPDKMKEELGINKSGTALVEKPEKQNPNTPPDVKSGAGEKVTPRAIWQNYTREEKKLLALEVKAAGSKEARKKIAGKYGIPGRVLHGWNMVYSGNIHHEKNPAPTPPPIEAAEEKYICLDNCQCPAGECKYMDKKTADPSAGNCPGYIPPKAEPTPEKKYSCKGDDCLHLCNCLRPDVTLDGDGLPTCPDFKVWEKKAEPAATPEHPSVGDFIIKVKVNTEQLISDIVEAEAKQQRLGDLAKRIQMEINALRRTVLPPFRWYWVFFPTTIRQYFAAMRELINK